MLGGLTKRSMPKELFTRANKMAEPLVFDVKMLGLFVVVMGGIVLLLKRLGFKIKTGGQLMEVAQTVRPALASNETLIKLEVLDKKKQDEKHC